MGPEGRKRGRKGALEGSKRGQSLPILPILPILTPRFTVKWPEKRVAITQHFQPSRRVGNLPASGSPALRKCLWACGLHFKPASYTYGENGRFTGGESHAVPPLLWPVIAGLVEGYNP
jgi:hypothetical protein